MIAIAEPPKIIRRDVAVEAEDSFLDYSMSVIVSRALPDARDGLKPSQRRILQAMHDLHLSPGAQHRKCAKISGDTSGNYHPHGEAVIYPTLVHLAQPWALRYPLVDGQGNFGSPDGDPPAAMRYTEARLTAFGAMMLEDLDKETVDWQPNYDGTSQEPKVFPSALPNMLVNGSAGIAVGMATNIPPHNLGEVVSAIVAWIDNPLLSIGQLMEVMPGPDFPTGAQIFGRQGIADYMATGRGSFRLRSRYTIDELSGGKSQIIFHELTYHASASAITSKIAGLVADKKIEGITNVQDESSNEGPRIVVDLRRDAIPQVVVNNLLKLTELEVSYPANILGLRNGEPVPMSVLDMIEAFVDHRREVVRRRLGYELRQAEARAHLLEGYRIALANLDQVIAITRAAASRDAAKDTLMGTYSLSERQALGVLDLRIYQLSAMERDKVDKEHSDLVAEITRIRGILASDPEILAIIKEALLRIKEKHGDPRKSEIITDQGDLTDESLIPQETTVITMSHQGFVKRTSADTWHSQRRGGKGVIGMKKQDGEEDFVEHLFIANTHHHVLFITDRGRAYVEKAYAIPDLDRTSKGRGIAQVIDMQEGEKVAAMAVVPSFEEGKFLLTVTDDGTVKKTALSAYANVRKNGIIAVQIADGSKLIGAEITDGSKHIILVTREGMSIRFPESDIRPVGRNSMGVIGIRPDAADRVVSLAVAEPDACLLVVGERGIGKRTAFEEYRVQSRGGKGIITMKTTAKTGSVVGALVVRETDELMLVTAEGQIVRQGIGQIREAGRNTMGVTLINLNDSDRLQAVARIREDVAADADSTSPAEEVAAASQPKTTA